MSIDRKPIFAAVRRIRGGQAFTLDEVHILDAGIDQALGGLVTVAPAPIVVPVSIEIEPVSQLSLTRRVAMELISHEAIICEGYKDSVGIWTWGIGVTTRSGHAVERYRDNPQPVERVLEVFMWLLREKYIPGVVKAFEGFTLTEAQFAAALSFHYNTGAIGKASWVGKVKAGDMAGGARAIMEWKKPPEIIERRGKERDLFFKGHWSSDGKATIYDVRKPSYSPNWKTARRVDVSADLDRLMGAR